MIINIDNDFYNEPNNEGKTKLNILFQKMSKVYSRKKTNPFTKLIAQTRNVLKLHHKVHFIGTNSAMVMNSEIRNVGFIEAHLNSNDIDDFTLS